MSPDTVQLHLRLIAECQRRAKAYYAEQRMSTFVIDENAPDAVLLDVLSSALAEHVAAAVARDLG